MQAAHALNDVAAMQSVMRRCDHDIPMAAVDLRVQYLNRKATVLFHDSCRQCGLTTTTNHIPWWILHGFRKIVSEGAFDQGSHAWSEPFGGTARRDGFLFKRPIQGFRQGDGLASVAGHTVMNYPAMIGFERHHARLTDGGCSGCCNNTL